MKSIHIESKRKNEKSIQAKFPDAIIIDVTSKGTEPFVRLSPFYPHGDIPIPFSEGYKSMSVEGIWQGLKVFNNVDVDMKSFENKSMKGLKRTVRKYGSPLGHRMGVKGEELLTYLDARRAIYFPSYLWVLQNKVDDTIKQLRDKSLTNNLVLLDYETNDDINNPKKPLSHAYLVKQYILREYPR